MNIEKNSSMPEDLRGRPTIYPFKDLEPGDKLTVPCDPYVDAPVLRNKVNSALYQFKRLNSLKWKTAVRVVGENICVYRIS